MKIWKVTINGVEYHDKSRAEGVVSTQMWTAVTRCLKSHFKNYPKQRYHKADIFVRCMGEVQR